MTTVTVIIVSLTTNMKIAIIIIVAITKNNYNYNNNNNSNNDNNNNNNNNMHTADLLHRIWQICDILADLLRSLADLLRALADLWHLADLLQPTFVFNPHVSASRHYLSGTKERQQGDAGLWIGISYIVVD